MTRLVLTKAQGEKGEIEMQIRKRGLGKYLRNIRTESEDETDMETIQERKEILMTEMEHILDTLLTKERKKHAQTWPSKKQGQK